MDIESVNALVPKLRPHIATIEVKRRGRAFVGEEEGSGYGVVIGERLIAALCFVVRGADEIHVVGIGDRALDAQIVRFDLERRVALIETREPLATVGLSPSKLAPRASRVEEQPVFALTDTGEAPSILEGTVLDEGDQEEYEGQIRTSFALTAGMPVFDGRGRFVGYSRFVSWDVDKFMLVPGSAVSAVRAELLAQRARPPAWIPGEPAPPGGPGSRRSHTATTASSERAPR